MRTDFKILLSPSLFTFLRHFWVCVSEGVLGWRMWKSGRNAWKCAGILSQHFNRLQRASRQVQTSFLRETSAWTDCLSSLVRFRFYFFPTNTGIFIQHIQEGPCLLPFFWNPSVCVGDFCSSLDYFFVRFLEVLLQLKCVIICSEQEQEHGRGFNREIRGLFQ